MKAAAIYRFGPPSMLKLHVLPMPVPDDGEVLIALHAAGVGVWDADEPHNRADQITSRLLSVQNIGRHA